MHIAPRISPDLLILSTLAVCYNKDTYIDGQCVTPTHANECIMNLTSAVSSDRRIRLTVHQKAAYSVGSTPVTCILYRVKQCGHFVGYALKLESSHEHYIYCVGRDRLSAYALFGVAVGQTVAPCTLGDILEDMRFTA